MWLPATQTKVWLLAVATKLCYICISDFEDLDVWSNNVDLIKAASPAMTVAGPDRMWPVDR